MRDTEMTNAQSCSHSYPKPERFLERHLHRWYVRWIRPHITKEIDRQRLKLIWFIGGYWPLAFISSLSLFDRLNLILRFLSVDWNVLHGHRPSEITSVCKALAERPARPTEALVEAGSWHGGSSAKFSILCRILGYRLHIYDSFEGVAELTSEEKQESYDFSGEYAAPEAVLRSNLLGYGEATVCSIHKGWFAETLAVCPVPDPVRVAYIDCDLARGTREVLRGVVPRLVDDGWIFSQDFHIKPVQELLTDSATWEEFGKGSPNIVWMCGSLASLRFTRK